MKAFAIEEPDDTVALLKQELELKTDGDIRKLFQRLVDEQIDCVLKSVKCHINPDLRCSNPTPSNCKICPENLDDLSKNIAY